MMAAGVVTALGALSAATQPHMLTFGMVALGPPFAVLSAEPGAVALVGSYTFVTGFAVSTGQGLLGSTAQVTRLIVILISAVLSWFLARHHRTLLRANADAGPGAAPVSSRTSGAARGPRRRAAGRRR
jgi:hypothetical protein